MMKTERRQPPSFPWSIETTLLELVRTVQDVSRSDAEVVSVVSRLVNGGRLMLRDVLTDTHWSKSHLRPRRKRRGTQE